MEHEEIKRFLGEVRIGDDILLRINSASSRREPRYVRGRIVDLNYYHLWITDPKNTPDKVVPEQQADISMNSILEHQVLGHWY